MKAWSYSQLTSFETCPYRHYRTKVKKDVTEPETDELRWGNRVHKALELRARDGTPLPTGMTQWEPIMDKLTAAPGELLVESQFALDEHFHRTDWFSKSTWLRFIIDFGKQTQHRALLLDYKTGKVKHNIEQLRLMAAGVMEIFPDLKEVVCGYVWLKDHKVTKERFVRDDKAAIWNGFIPRVSKLNEAHKTNNWPTNPSGLCKRHCPVLSCQHNGRNGA